ncbi:MAG: hypothetical protein JWO68_778 [Actinomycetia bacterium]|nr:hypothetical protein [Actinomycetes bacterium]
MTGATAVAVEAERRRPRRLPPRAALWFLCALAALAAPSPAYMSTWTFGAETSNLDATWATTALSPATDLVGTVASADVRLSWTNVTGETNTGVGYRIGWKDLGAAAADGSAPGACTTDSFATVGSVSSSPFTDVNPAVVDGQFGCYQVNTVLPCCPAPALPWTNLTNSPMVAVEHGHTIASATTTGGGLVPGTLEAGEAIDVTFNQPFATDTAVSGTICTDPTSGAIYVGMSGTAAAACDPGTETLSGFRLLATVVVGARRYAMTVSYPGCADPATTGCSTIKITVGARDDTGTTILDQTDAVVGVLPFVLAPSASSAALHSKIGDRAVCASGGTVGLVRTDPSGGRCTVAVASAF